jgi:hypothetical protein
MWVYFIWPFCCLPALSLCSMTTLGSTLFQNCLIFHFGPLGSLNSWCMLVEKFLKLFMHLSSPNIWLYNLRWVRKWQKRFWEDWYSSPGPSCWLSTAMTTRPCSIAWLVMQILCMTFFFFFMFSFSQFSLNF